MKDFFVSRKFWAAFIVLMIVIVQAFIPDFDLEVESVVALVIVVVSYLTGLIVDPGPPGLQGILVSRKFWAAAIGLVIIFMDAFNLVLPFELSPEQLVGVAVTLGGYIVSVMFEPPHVEPQATLKKPKKEYLS